MSPQSAADKVHTATDKVTKPRGRKGEGTVFEIKTGGNAGKWRCALVVNGEKRTFLGTEDEARAKLVEFRGAQNKGEPLPAPRKVKVARYATDWLERIKPEVSPKTYKDYSSSVRNHIVPSLGRCYLQLEVEDYERLWADCRKRSLSYKSQINVKAALSSMLSDAKDRKLVSAATRVVPPPRHDDDEDFEPDPFTPDEVRQFLAVVQGAPEEALYVTTLALGLRRGEVCGLRWSDINWADRQVRLHGQAQRQTGQGVAWRKRGKTKNSANPKGVILDAPDFAMEVLLAHRDRHMFLDPRPQYVFPGLEDPSKPLDPDKVTKDFPKWLEAHGLRRIRFHDLRHSCASLYLGVLGVPMWQVSKLMRHTSERMTAVYGHMFPVTSRENTDQLDSYVKKLRATS